ncbi:MAG: hypothetical protein MZV63_64645 [Marinilabiliales bacterium]|nr:hypothetical protein [Marinilabiliales bacterium]
MSVLKTIKFRLTLWYLDRHRRPARRLRHGRLLSCSRGTSTGTSTESLRARVDRARADSIKIEGRPGPVRAEGQRARPDLRRRRGALMQRLGPNVEFANIDEAVQQALFGIELVRLGLDGQRGPTCGCTRRPSTSTPGSRVALVVGRLPNDILNMLAIFRMAILNSSILLARPGRGGRPVPGRPDPEAGRAHRRHRPRHRRERPEPPHRRRDGRRAGPAGLDPERHDRPARGGLHQAAPVRGRRLARAADAPGRHPGRIVARPGEAAGPGAEYRQVARARVAGSGLHVRDRRQAARPGPERRRLGAARLSRTSIWPDLLAELAQDLEALAQEKGLEFDLRPDGRR